MDFDDIKNLTIDDIKEIVKLYDSAKVSGLPNSLTPLVNASGSGNLKFGEIIDVLYDPENFNDKINNIDKYLSGILCEMLRWQVCRNSRYVDQRRRYAKLCIHFNPFRYLYNNSLGKSLLTDAFEKHKTEIYTKAIQRLVGENVSVMSNLQLLSRENYCMSGFTDKVPYPLSDYSLDDLYGFCEMFIRDDLKEIGDDIPIISAKEACSNLPEDIKREVHGYAHVYNMEVKNRCGK